MNTSPGASGIGASQTAGIRPGPGPGIMAGMESLARCRGYGQPIYIYPDVPFWFVPTPIADRLLILWMKGARWEDMVGWLRTRPGSRPDLSCALDLERLFASIRPPPARPYTGRIGLPLERLSELWIHLTDSCTLRCRHCLFENRPAPCRRLEPATIEKLVSEASALGCRLACFTGGEPLSYPGFFRLLGSLLGRPGLRVAVLTNGVLIPDQERDLGRLDPARVHFQVSLDGPEPVHDALRGQGTFRRTTAGLRILVASGIPCSLAMAVSDYNVSSMESVVEIAHALGIGTVHFIWHFPRGPGRSLKRPPARVLIERFKAAAERGARLAVRIDNLEAMRAQVFSPVGTRFDLGNAAWESLAIGPDGIVYPTPAMVDMKAFAAGSIDHGIEKVWRKSPLLERIRTLSLTEIPGVRRDPFRFVTGGGDLDHCCADGDTRNDGPRLRADPYMALYREMVRMVIAEAVGDLPVSDRPGLVLRMGELTADCPSSREIAFTHTNCLLSLGEGTRSALVQGFYDERADQPDRNLLNPVSYDEERIAHIPEEARVRAYGCGSPVLDADVAPGETVLDLGCGAGVECFIAAKETGPEGRAVGLDGSETMLAIASHCRRAVREALGYGNTFFLKGSLDQVPLADRTADLVISNCVVNLSRHKRRVFLEILRVLKPGGRLVLSDVVTDEEPPPSIRGDHRLIGECIGGAMVQETLLEMLSQVGFVDASILKRFAYRTVQGHRFFSLTLRAYRPAASSLDMPPEVLYAGPFRAVVTDDGAVLRRGVRQKLALSPGLDPSAQAEAGILLLDPVSGAVTSTGEAGLTCSCSHPSTPRNPTPGDHPPRTGCLICGAPITYLAAVADKACARCGATRKANAVCRKGHFVCDTCHIQDPKERILHACTTTRETDMLRLFQQIRAQGRFPLHGPEHHALVPGVILATYKNLGGNLSGDQIRTAIDLGATVPGGSCAFTGVCGAAAGVGIAFSILLGANPLTPQARQEVQRVVGSVIGRLAEQEAARCCQRDSVLALQEAARLSRGLLPVTLRAGKARPCSQFARNAECIRTACPLFPEWLDGPGTAR